MQQMKRTRAKARHLKLLQEDSSQQNMQGAKHVVVTQIRIRKTAEAWRHHKHWRARKKRRINRMQNQVTMSSKRCTHNQDSLIQSSWVSNQFHIPIYPWYHRAVRRSTTSNHHNSETNICTWQHKTALIKEVTVNRLPHLLDHSYQKRWTS